MAKCHQKPSKNVSEGHLVRTKLTPGQYPSERILLYLVYKGDMHHLLTAPMPRMSDQFYDDDDDSDGDGEDDAEPSSEGGVKVSTIYFPCSIYS
jgi:hypothetical protein